MLREVVCTRVSEIWIINWGVAVNGRWLPTSWGTQRIDVEEDQLARADGFASIDDMLDWFHKTHGLPFEGVLIEWEAPKP